MRAILDQGYSTPGACRAAEAGELEGYDPGKGVPPIPTVREWVQFEKRFRAEVRIRNPDVPIEDLIDELIRDAILIARREMERAKRGGVDVDLKHLARALAELRKIAPLVPKRGASKGGTETPEAEEMPNGHGAIRLAETVAAKARAGQSHAEQPDPPPTDIEPTAPEPTDTAEAPPPSLAPPSDTEDGRSDLLAEAQRRADERIAAASP